MASDCCTAATLAAGKLAENTKGRASGPADARATYASFATFADPDGNRWLFQEITQRLPGRLSPSAPNPRTNEIILDALKNASAAHGVHEKEIGKPDPDWPQWYAAHMTRALAAAGLQLTEASA